MPGEKDKNSTINGEVDKSGKGKTIVTKAVQDGPNGDEPQFGNPEPLGGVGKTVLGIGFVSMALLLGYLIYVVWPSGKTDANGNVLDHAMNLFGFHFSASAEINLILLVMVTSAIGSYVHTATSFADFVGNRRIYRSWTWWYVLRVFIGVSLAIVFYFVIRAGFFSTGATTKDLNTFGVAAVSGLVGMFSKQATDKLRELFDNMFKTAGGEERADSLSHPKPEINGSEPSSIFKNSTQDVKMELMGTGFVPESIVKIDGVEKSTEYASATKLRVTIPKTALTSLGAEIALTVFNSPPGGGTSNEFKIKIV